MKATVSKIESDRITVKRLIEGNGMILATQEVDLHPDCYHTISGGLARGHVILKDGSRLIEGSIIEGDYDGEHFKIIKKKKI